MGIGAIAASIPVLWGYRDSTSGVPDDNDKWHSAGFIMRVCFGIAAFQSYLEWLPAYGFYVWLLFDISYNLWEGNKWNYVGKTAKTDKKFGNKAIVYKCLGLIITVLSAIGYDYYKENI